MSPRVTTPRRAARTKRATIAVLVSCAAGLGSLALSEAAQAAVTHPAATAAVSANVSFTSDDNTTVDFGTAFSFTVTTTSTTGSPKLTKSGLLPPGVAFTDNGDGTGTLAGTVSGRGQGVYPLRFHANNNGHGYAEQDFTLTVDRAPALIHQGTVRAHVGVPLDVKLRAWGYPVPWLPLDGTLPDGLTFTDNGDGTADLAGTPAAGSGGNYEVTLTADDNGLGSDSETFTVKVLDAPAFTSSDTSVATVGDAFSFPVTTTGFPAPSVLKTGGDLPHGVRYVARTGTFEGTPKAGSAGVYTVTLTASNEVGSATQAFTLIVA
jgi:large repetitive protein